jgi:hypothetical protein
MKKDTVKNMIGNEKKHHTSIFFGKSLWSVFVTKNTKEQLIKELEIIIKELKYI